MIIDLKEEEFKKAYSVAKPVIFEMGLQLAWLKMEGQYKKF